MRLYAGATSELRTRVREHATGQVRSAASRRPFVLIYYEACRNAEDAVRRERFLQTGKGNRYPLRRERLGGFLDSVRRNKLERH